MCHTEASYSSQTVSLSHTIYTHTNNMDADHRETATNICASGTNSNISFSQCPMSVSVVWDELMCIMRLVTQPKLSLVD